MSSLPRFIENLLSKIDFCCMTGERQKICFRRKTTVDSNGWYGSVYRWWWDEDHNKLADRLRSMIYDAAEILDNAEWSKYRCLIFYRLVSLDQFVVRQESVYEDNIDAKSKLAPIRDSIKEQLGKIHPEEEVDMARMVREAHIPKYSSSAPSGSFSPLVSSVPLGSEGPLLERPEEPEGPKEHSGSQPIPIPERK